MNIEEFEALVQELKINNPKIFGLESDAKPTIEEIKLIEEYYEISLPTSYKEFLKKYGGGYFAYLVVYSMDDQSFFYLRNNVMKELIKINKFFPVIDFETGDLAGFKIINDVCEDMIMLYNHEDNVINDLHMNFFDAIAKYGLKK